MKQQIDFAVITHKLGKLTANIRVLSNHANNTHGIAKNCTMLQDKHGFTGKQLLRLIEHCRELDEKLAIVQQLRAKLADIIANDLPNTEHTDF